MKRKIFVLTMLLAAVVTCTVIVLSYTANNKPYTIKNGMIHFAEPERAETSPFPSWFFSNYV